MPAAASKKKTQKKVPAKASSPASKKTKKPASASKKKPSAAAAAKRISINSMSDLSTSSDQLSKLQQAMDSGQHIMVLVHANWCGYCQRFEQSGQWDQLARRVPDNVTLLQVESEPYSHLAQHHPDYHLCRHMGQVSGFPHFAALHPSGGGQGGGAYSCRVYEGERTADAMASFILGDL